MEIYCGCYENIHYIIQIGWKNIYIRYDDKEVKVKAIVKDDSKVIWRINAKSIRYRSPEEFCKLLNEDNEYADSVFYHFCLKGE